MSDIAAIGNGPFQQQNITHNRKSFVTQSKLMIVLIKLKVLESLCMIELDFGCGPFWLCFCLNRVLREQMLKVLSIFFFQNYNIR